MNIKAVRSLTQILVCLNLCTMAYGQYYDSTVQSSAEDYLTRVNERLGEAALNKVPRADALYLAGTFGQLDRFTIPPEVFIQHIELAGAMRNRFYPNIPDEAFRQYVLELRIRSEFTSRAGWRQPLHSELTPLIGNEKDISKAAGTVFSWIQSKVKLVGQPRTYRLNLKGDLDPLTTLRGRRGTETDVAILGVACLRSIGIAARIVYAPVIANENGGKVWLEYRDDKDWQTWAPSAPPGVACKEWLKREFAGKWAYILANPADPVNITSSYAPVTPLWLCPHPLTMDKFDGMAMVFSDGRLQPISGRDIYNIEPENANAGIGLGDYIIVTGDKASYGGIKPIRLRGEAPGWYQMDFESRKQHFAQSKQQPEFFEWSPDPPEIAAGW
jgi:hypothetical protein